MRVLLYRRIYDLSFDEAFDKASMIEELEGEIQKRVLRENGFVSLEDMYHVLNQKSEAK